MFDHPVFYILPLFVPLLQGYILGLLCLKWSLATPKRQNNVGHSLQKPECPACQKENSTEPIPAKPPVIEHHLGRHRGIDTNNHYCPNPDCTYYGWLGLGNIVSNGHPNSGRWRQLECTVCGKYFMETKGTIFYRNHTLPDTIWQAIKALAEGLDIQATARVFEVKPDTVQHWLKQASKHMETVSRYMLCDLHLTQVQVDELWALMGEATGEA